MRWAVALAALALSSAACADPAAAPTTYAELLRRPHPAPIARLSYGSAPSQVGELWLPPGPGPHPVAVLIHGGCWRAELPGLALMTPMAQALRERGYAVWNIEYARLGEAAGGFPRTFTDIGAAVDHLRAMAPTHRLDLSRVVLIGHSAGGHLALWAAARGRLPAGSPLRVANPLPVRGVVSLAGIGDLETFAGQGPGACGEASTVPALTAGSAGGDTSPVDLLPLGAPAVIVSGAVDPIVPPAFGQAFAARAAARSVVVPGAGHFELIDPRAAAWATVGPLIDELANAAPALHV